MSKVISCLRFALIACALAFGGHSLAEINPSSGFKIFLSVPSSVVSEDAVLSKYLFQNPSLFKANVVYESRFLVGGVVDVERLSSLSRELAVESSDIVVVDAEFGDRFDPATNLPDKIRIADILKKSGVRSPVGVYGTFPQVIYRSRSDYSYYDKLNNNYAELLGHVDFLSPVLYNYNGKSFDSWLSVASYQIDYAKKRGRGKPIFPFVSPVYWDAPLDKKDGLRLISEVPKEDFLMRLRALKRLGADGCIIWIGSRYKLADGVPYRVKVNSQWVDALRVFSSE